MTDDMDETLDRALNEQTYGKPGAVHSPLCQRVAEALKTACVLVSDDVTVELVACFDKPEDKDIRFTLGWPEPTGELWCNWHAVYCDDVRGLSDAGLTEWARNYIASVAQARRQRNS